MRGIRRLTAIVLRITSGSSAVSRRCGATAVALKDFTAGTEVSDRRWKSSLLQDRSTGCPQRVVLDVWLAEAGSIEIDPALEDVVSSRGIVPRAD